MKLKKVTVIILVLAACFLGVYFIINPVQKYRNNQLRKAVEALSSNAGTTMEAAIPFEWDYIYSFVPYTPKETMEDRMGVKSKYITEANSDDMMQIYVVKNNKIVAFINEEMELDKSLNLPEKVKYGEKIKIEKK